MRRVAGKAIRRLGGSSIASVKTAAVIESDGTLPQTYPILRQLFQEPQRVDLLGEEIVAGSRHQGDPYVYLLQRTIDREAELDLMSLVSYAEARTYMHDVLLRDTDQISMSRGLEVRVPLLDHRLVEHLMRMPEAAKTMAQGPPKALLTQSLDRALPPFCIDRPKRGFARRQRRGDQCALVALTFRRQSGCAGTPADRGRQGLHDHWRRTAEIPRLRHRSVHRHLDRPCARQAQ